MSNTGNSYMIEPSIETYAPITNLIQDINKPLSTTDNSCSACSVRVTIALKVAFFVLFKIHSMVNLWMFFLYHL